MKFQKGVLYVRVFDGEPAELFYPDEEVPQKYNNFHVQNIARMRWDIAEPSFGGAVECSRHGERTGAGNLIEFRKANDSDIKMFMHKWSKRAMSNIPKWVYEVSEHAERLLLQEKLRIASIAQELGYELRDY